MPMWESWTRKWKLTMELVEDFPAAELGVDGAGNLASLDGSLGSRGTLDGGGEGRDGDDDGVEGEHFVGLMGLGKSKVEV